MVRGDIIPHSPVGKEASSNSGIFSCSQARCRPQMSPCLAQFLHGRPCFLAKRLKFSHLKSLCWGSIHASLPGLPPGWTKSMWRRCCKAECHPSLVQGLSTGANYLIEYECLHHEPCEIAATLPAQHAPWGTIPYLKSKTVQMIHPQEYLILFEE